jgi:glycosyltransferase involved in cell wall biosynthesis
MKVAIISEGIGRLTGFGQQTKYLAEGLKRQGLEVHIIGSMSAPLREVDIHQWFCDNFNLKELDRILNIVKPDVVIGFHCYSVLCNLIKSNVIPTNCIAFLWMAWEGSVLPKDVDKLSGFPKDQIINLTEYAKKLWRDKASNEVIPHGVDTTIFDKVKVDYNKINDRLGGKLRSSSIKILNVDRNNIRKNWDFVFSVIKKLKANGLDVQLIAHCRPVDNGVGDGYDLKYLAEKFGIVNEVVLSPFNWTEGLSQSELAELYSLCTYRISCSGGEGFGLPTVEAGLCECINIVPNNTCFPEILGTEIYCTRDVGLCSKYDTIYSIPNIIEMYNEIMNFNNKERIKVIKERLRREYSHTLVGIKWKELLDKTVGLNKDNLYYDYRYGFRTKQEKELEYKVLAKCVKLISNDMNVIVYGAGDGELLEFCQYENILISGYEFDEKFIEKQRLDIKALNLSLMDIESMSFNCCVVFDLFERIEESNSLFDDLKSHRWILVREKPSYNWNKVEFTDDKIQSRLDKAGLLRRMDIEELLKNKIGTQSIFGLQVWQNTTATDDLPILLRN